MAGSSVIGALRVNLGLDAAQFTKGMKNAQSSLQGIATKFGKIAASITAAALPALSALTVSAINSASEIKRLSQVANAAPTEFQRWAAGAKTVGIEQEKMADILKDVNDRVGDFVATGGGPMVDFFERIAPKVGITAESFRNLSGPQALQLYVSSLEKANLNQQDMTFFMEAMASDSTLLIPLLRDGGKAMTELGDRAEAMGAVMSGGMLTAFNAAKTSITDMQTALTGMKNSLAVIALPAINAISAAITTMAMLLHQHAQTIQTAFLTLAGIVLVVSAYFATKYAAAVGVMAVQAMASAVGQSIALEMALGAQSRAAAMAGVATKALAGALAFLKKALIATGIGAVIVLAGYLIGKFMEIARATGGIGNAFSLLGDVASGVWEGIKGSAQSVPTALAGVWSSVKADFFMLMSELSFAWASFLGRMGASFRNAGMTGFADKLKAAEGAADTGGDEWLAASNTAYADAQVQYAAASEMATAGFDKAGEALGKLNATTIKTEEISVSAGAGLAQLGDKAGGGAAKLSKLQEVMKSLNEELTKARATMNMDDLGTSIWEKQTEAGVSAESAAGQQIDAQMRMIDGYKRLKEATGQWRDSVKSAFTSFITGASSFKETLSSIIMKLAEMVANSAFDALFSGMGGGGGILGALGGIFGGFRANGGGVSAGKSYVVGERGPEVFTPGASGMITPNHALGGGAGVIKVEAVPNPYFDVRVSQISQHGDRMAAAAGRRAMPGAIQEAQRRGTR